MYGVLLIVRLPNDEPKFNFPPQSDPDNLPTTMAPLPFKWTAILALLCYLTNPSDTYHLVGEIALRGFIHAPLFPRLGLFLQSAQLLRNAVEFLKKVDRKEGSGSLVYDVNAGDVYMCANGAATRLLARSLARRKKTMLVPRVAAGAVDGIEQEDSSRTPLMAAASRSSDGSTAASSASDHFPELARTTLITPKFEQEHTLQIIRLSREEQTQINRGWLRLKVLPRVVTISTWLLLIFLVVTCVFNGAFGTGILLSLSLILDRIGAISGVEVKQDINPLPSEDAAEGCMLVSSGQSATDWQLYIGDMHGIDTLLSRPMIGFTGPKMLLSIFFYAAYGLQLIWLSYAVARTYSDGTFLLILTLFTWTVKWIKGNDSLVKTWLHRHSLAVVSQSFRFTTGRMPLLGTVQLLSGSSVSTWMDTISQKAPLRDVWLECIGAEQLTDQEAEAICRTRNLSAQDTKWVTLNNRLVRESYAVVARELAAATSSDPVVA